MPELPTTDAQAGVAALYHEHRSAIVAYLTRVMGDREAAEDLCQEAFLKALRAWASRDAEACARAWIFRIATNTAYDELRRRRRTRTAPMTAADLVPDGRPAADERLGDGEQVRAALRALPERYRVPLLLHEYHGQTLDEIAGALGCTNAAIKLRLFRARACFRAAYERADGAPTLAS